MRIVIQRVTEARVRVGNEVVGEIGKGIVILVGVGPDDGETQALYLAEKSVNLRIFEDEQGKTNLSLLDTGCKALVVSQFTLYADTRKGRRPSFIRAALPGIAEPLVEKFASFLRAKGVPTEMGRFGAHMQVELTNDGPMTIFIEKD